ncbi:MAG TPA: hypothetical protein VMH86_01580 [Rhizomicrobium sp.]|nr:hypothetical protein [Rhizomicrobium sp.]
MTRYRKKIDRTALILIPVLALVVIAAFGGLWWLVGGPSVYEGVNTDTFCRTTGKRSITVVVIDATDPFTPEQSQRLLSELKVLRDSVPRFDAIEIFAIDSSKPGGVSAPLLKACNPGRAEEADKFRENARIVAKKYENLFDKPFRSALDEVLASATQERSPILEGIENATVQAFGTSNGDPELSKRLVVISDMLQNTEDLSFYNGGIPTFPNFKDSNAYRLHRPMLSGVTVSVWEINRANRNVKAGKLRRSEVAKFWTDYFTDEGATLSDAFWDATKI